MSSEEKRIVPPLYEGIINIGKFDMLGEVLDPGIVWHDPLLPNGKVRGIKISKISSRCSDQLFLIYT